MAQIYLMYAREDKIQVDGVYRHLQASGFHPWIDDDILPGQNWRQEIAKQIRRSELILVFLSQRSIRERGHIQHQFKMALAVLNEIPENTIHTIPVRLDDVEIPEQFNFLHACNFFEENGFEKLLEAIRVGISQRSSSLAPVMPEIVRNPTIVSQPHTSSSLENDVSQAAPCQISQATSHAKKERERAPGTSEYGGEGRGTNRNDSLFQAEFMAQPDYHCRTYYFCRADCSATDLNIQSATPKSDS